jgi:hypothetical protein
MVGPLRFLLGCFDLLIFNFYTYIVNIADLGKIFLYPSFNTSFPVLPGLNWDLVDLILINVLNCIGN